MFVNCVKRHICHVKNWLLGHDLHAPVNDRVISPFHKGFIFSKLGEAKVKATLKFMNLKKCKQLTHKALSGGV